MSMFKDRVIPAEGYASPFQQKEGLLPVQDLLTLPRVVLDPRLITAVAEKPAKPETDSDPSSTTQA